MKTFRKSLLAIVGLLICLLTTLTTIAYYRARRQATGVIKFDSGIVIDYSTDKELNIYATWEKNVVLSIVPDKSVLLGETIDVSDLSIKANDKSDKFYARLKYEFKFFDKDLNEIDYDNQTPAQLIIPSNKFISDLWTKNGEYYYYNSLIGYDFVNIFKNANFKINGEAYNTEYGGFKINETDTIEKVSLNLEIDTLQANDDAIAEWQSDTTETFTFTEIKEDELYCNNINVSTLEIQQGKEYSVLNNSKGYSFELNEDNTISITENVGEVEELEFSDKLLIGDKFYSITKISNKAFENCNTLRRLTIGKYVSLGENPFIGCTALTTLISANPDICLKNGVIIDKNRVVGCVSDEIVLDDEITEIGAYAFCYATIKSIDLGSVETICDYAFSGVQFSEPTNLTIDATRLKSIGNNVFDCCENVDIVTFSNVTQLFSITESTLDGTLTVNLQTSIENETKLTEEICSDLIWSQLIGCISVNGNCV